MCCSDFGTPLEATPSCTSWGPHFPAILVSAEHSSSDTARHPTMATNAQVAELMTRTLAAIDALTARVVAIETAPAAQAQAHKGARPGRSPPRARSACAGRRVANRTASSPDRGAAARGLAPDQLSRALVRIVVGGRASLCS